MRNFCKFSYAATISILCILSSCTERIEIDTDDAEPVVSIYSEISGTEQIQTVTVKMTAPYFSNQENPVIDDATVTISGDNGELWNLEYTENGVYATAEKIAGKEGVTYTMNVTCDYNNDGIADVYTAQTTIPVFTQLDKVEYEPLKVGTYSMYTIVIYTKVPDNYQYCLYRFYVNDSLIMHTIDDAQIADVQFWNKDYIDGLVCGMFHDKKDLHKFSEEEIEDNFFIGEGDDVMIEMSMIDKYYYRFIDQCKTELHGENPMFGGPASNIITNISNGAVGYFGSQNPSRQANIVPPAK